MRFLRSRTIGLLSRPPNGPALSCRPPVNHYATTDALWHHHARPRHGSAPHPEPAELAKSDIYRELLPALNRGRVELLDVPRLVSQLVGLERRTSRGGRDSIDHAPGGHDDPCKPAAGAGALRVRKPRPRWAGALP